MRILVSYPFWLFAVSVFCIVLERLWPWRKTQGFLRPQLVQDYWWLVFNGVLSSFMLAPLLALIYAGLKSAYFSIPAVSVQSAGILSTISFWHQVIILLTVSDFIEWCVHNLLHRNPWLWKIHRVHHSITIMDWIGNFRFHWGETIIYSTIKYLPLMLLAPHWQAVLVVAVMATAMGHLNHSNLNISWGPLRYVFNSSRMHIWHHEKKFRKSAGVNFGIVLSVWDWLFGTAYMPQTGADQPAEIGYYGQEKVSNSLIKRFFVPFMD